MIMDVYAEIADEKGESLSNREAVIVNMRPVGWITTFDFVQEVQFVTSAACACPFVVLYKDKDDLFPLVKIPIGRDIAKGCLINMGQGKEKDLWHQGNVLLTPITERMSKEDLDFLQNQEECMVFRNFTAADEGRSRTLVAVFKKAEDARRAVEDHNAAEITR